MTKTTNRPEHETCDECDGAGERCGACGEHPDNCDCENNGETWVECTVCLGTGTVEAEIDMDDDNAEVA